MSKKLAKMTFCTLLTISLSGFAHDEFINSESFHTAPSNPALQDASFFSQPKKSISIGIENYSPNGKSFTNSQTQYDLSYFGKSLMPNITIGFVSKSRMMDEFFVNYSINTNIAYTENTQVMDGKFSSSVFSIQPSMKVHWRTKEKIMTRIRGELGQQQIALSGSSQYQSFNKSAFFMGYGLGIEWAPNSTESITNLYSFFADYYERAGLTSDQDWVPYNSAIQIGISYYW